MFKLRRDAHANGRADERLTEPTARRAAVDSDTEGHSKEAQAAAGRAARPQADALTLATACVCGHTRRDHRGLRIERAGACLECDCHEFRRARQTQESHVEMIETVRAALERVERLQEIVAGLRPHLDGELLEAEQWLALRRDLCGEEMPHPMSGANGRDGAGEPDLAQGEHPPGAAQLRIRHYRRATVVSIGSLELYAGAREAMLVVGVGGNPMKRWRVAWRGQLGAAVTRER
ncbi:MAG TPA: hypothetical protein VK778_04425 [Solirubrobacteraceae bacterium]|jgi:hypothetical protein|nr:hypothetical protein [Solirubrobacteraceae bacterium]